MGRNKKDTPRQTDKERIDELLDNFDYKQSEHCKYYLEKFQNPRQPIIKQMMKCISSTKNIALIREEKKSRKLLLKWIHDHWEDVYPMLDQFTLKADDKDLNISEQDPIFQQNVHIPDINQTDFPHTSVKPPQ